MLNVWRRMSYSAALLAILVILFFSARGTTASAQALSGAVQGTVVDPSDAVVPGADVQIQNPVSGYMRQTKTDGNGSFS